MKWTFIILTFIITGLLTAQANESKAQVSLETKVTIQLQNTTLKTALKTLSEKAKVDFAYNTKALPLGEKVNIKATDEPLSDVLTRMIGPLGLSYRVIGKNILIEKAPKKSEDVKTAEVVQPQTNTGDAFYVTGFVTDSVKSPLVGATVLNKKTNKSIITDDNGRFDIIAEDGDPLIITFVGYKSFPLTASTNNRTVRITLLATAQGLTEVVVSTGYQKLPQERATGSFDFINNKTLNQQVGSNILDRINGVASGVLFVNPQGLQNGPKNGIMIRGLSTINGLKDPLIVVDNFPYDGSITNINPNDIEDISILKDAAAASIWGVKAANGVIVITTKKGKLNRPMQVNFNAGVIMTTNPDMHSLRTISSSDYVGLEQFLFGKGIYNVYDDKGAQARLYPAFSPVIEALLAQRRGTISADSAQSIINASQNRDVRDQYGKYMYQKATTQQYNINVQGGSDKATYYLSAGYDKNIDQLDAKNERYTFRTDNTFKITKNFSVSTNLQYTRTDGLTGKPAYGTVSINNSQVPYLQFADQNGNALPIALTLRKPYTDTAGKGRLLDWNNYPLTDWQHSYTKSKLEDVLANVSVSYNILSGLNATVSYKYESQNLNANTEHDLSSYYARNLINQFSQINQATGIVTYNLPLGGILNQVNEKLETNNVRGQLSYDNQFGKNRVDAIAGAEVDQTSVNSFSSNLYGYNDNTSTTVPVDYINAYPSYVNGSKSTIPAVQNPLQGTLNRFVSLFANASYTYDDRYIVSASARKDGSNLFGVTSNNKWNPLWSAGLGWILSKENFYNSTLFPYLKLRATYGFSGNTNPSLAALLTLHNVTTGYPTFLNVSQISNFPNPGLRWEKDKTVNIAVDFGTKNQIISGSIEGYIKHGIDLYGPSPIDPTDGLNTASSIIKNIANMQGKGLEATLNFKVLNGGFKWNINTLYSYNSSKATKYNLDTTLKANSFVNSGASITNPIVGEPLYAVVAYKWGGLDNQGNPQGYLNGKLSEDYLSILNQTRKEDLVFRSALPTHFGNIINSFNYKGFNLIVNISYRFGYYFMKPTVYYSTLIGSAPAGPSAIIGSSDYAKRWQKPGDETKTNVPSFIYPDNQYRDQFYTESAVNIDKADNIKLQYINLSYDFSKVFKDNKLFKSSQVYFNASNLGILWKANHDGIDPDYFGNTPVSGKTFAIGIRAGF